VNLLESQRAAQGSSKPRVLFLSFKVRYLNPTRQWLQSVLADACDLVTFGPGYVPLELVAEGPAQFAQRHGPFDMIVGDEYCLLRPGSITEENKHGHKFLYQACDFDPWLIHEGERYFSFFKSFRGPRIITLFATDYYNLSEDFIAMLEEIGDYYVAWGAEFLLPKASIEDVSDPGKGLNGSIFEKCNDHYLDFAKRRSDRIISLPHFIAPSEMSNKPLSRRHHDWSVLGADYSARVEARRLIDGANLARSGKLLPYIFVGADRIGLHLYNKFWAIDLLNRLFRNAIRAARYGFTCGSLLRWPLRKYFEIPANGATLVAEQCSGFEALGFHHEKNAIACDARDVLAAHEWLESDPGRAQAIADAGRKLIETRHSTVARSRQFSEGLALIKDGRFSGSFWSDGNLHFRTTPATRQQRQPPLSRPVATRHKNS
jgi:hypothetical protein